MGQSFPTGWFALKITRPLLLVVCALWGNLPAFQSHLCYRRATFSAASFTLDMTWQRWQVAPKKAEIQRTLTWHSNMICKHHVAEITRCARTENMSNCKAVLLHFAVHVSVIHTWWARHLDCSYVAWGRTALNAALLHHHLSWKSSHDTLSLSVLSIPLSYESYPKFGCKTE